MIRNAILRTATDCVHELQTVRTVVATAFFDDPLSVWILPDPMTREHSLAALFGTMIEWYFTNGRVDVIEIDGSIVATALWDIPAHEVAPSDVLPSPDGLLRAAIGEERTNHVLDVYELFVATRPQAPHAYLHFLAVSPEWQGNGLGRQVIGPGLTASAEFALPVHLETNNATNLPFYNSLGFKCTSTEPLPYGGPTLYAMDRL